MILIDVNSLDYYRYAVGKVVFLEIYERYKLIEDISKSNSMIVNDIEENNTIMISIFSKPTNKKYEFDMVCVYYDKKHYPNAKKNQGLNLACLNDDFDKLYEKEMVRALINPRVYLHDLNTQYVEMFKSIFYNTNSIKKDDDCYKYCRQIKVTNNIHKIKDGQISFANPNTFNDPFDCNCVFANNEDMSNLFRIYCVAPDYDNILMWSYYGEDHKGYCLHYKKTEIVNELMKTGIDGLCIVGNVKYKMQRPKQRSSKNKLSYSEIKFYIKAAFTKYEEWHHEKEYRFVVISEDYPPTVGDYLDLQVSVVDAYVGCKGNKSVISDSYGKVINTVNLVKHPSEYKLINSEV